MRHNLTPTERFSHYVNKNGPSHPYTSALGQCWLWTGTLDRKGYGQFSIRSELQAFLEHGPRVVKAHRFAYEIAFHTDPGTMFVCHTCDNPTCVNPAHLFLGTNSDNMLDCVRKGRHKHCLWTTTNPNPKPPPPLFGTKNPGSKLTDDIIRDIRARAASGQSQRRIAAAIGVSPSSISLIMHRKIWSHVQ